MFYATWAALGVLAYTYFGYPLLIALCARARTQAIPKDPGHTPMVSALIPVYNAEAYIEEKLRSLQELDYPQERLEVLFYDDASSDGSHALLLSLERKHPGLVRVFRGDTRKGKPTALNTLRTQAKGSLLLMTDIRQPLNRRALRELASYFGDPGVGAVSGLLELRGETGAGVYWKYEAWIRKQEASFRGLVGVSGALYALRAEDLVDLPTDIALDDMWVPMRLRLRGRTIHLAQKAIAYDEAFEDGREFGRKARTLAGNYQLFAALPKLLSPIHNPSWFETMSHKVFRLLCPWALIVLFALSALGSFGQNGSDGAAVRLCFQVLFAGQLGFYCLALVGRKLGKLGGICRTFSVMNLAALVGFWRYLRSSQKVTW